MSANAHIEVNKDSTRSSSKSRRFKVFLDYLELDGTLSQQQFYKSRAEQVMKPANVELTLGHNIGVSQSYWKPPELEILDDYLKAVLLLSIEAQKIML